MKTQRIANTLLDVSRIAFGCMRLPEDRRQSVAIIKSVLDAGVNLFDHADIYQHGRAEETFSAIWSEVPGLRRKIVVQSKAGIRWRDEPNPGDPQRFDFSYRHIIEAVEGSLRRLRTDYLDILLLHRPDALVEPEEVARAFLELQRDGKVRYFGVSNHTGPQIDLLRRYVPFPLVANQLEISVMHPTLFHAGVITNQDWPPDAVRGEGTLEYCRLHDITVQAWGPLAAGKLTGRLSPDADERVRGAAATVAAMAAERGVPAETILIAWLLRHPARIQPIIGDMDSERIKACCRADGFDMTREEWYRLLAAGRGAPMP